MAITFNFELDKKKNSRGHYAIFIRITENRKHRKIKTSIELESLSHWQKKGQRISKKEPNYISWNNTLDKEMEKVKQTYRELKDEGKASTASTIINAVKKEDKTFNFISYAEEYAERTLSAGSYRTYTKYITFINKLKLYINRITPEEVTKLPKKKDEFKTYMSKLKGELLFTDITLSFLNKFKTYLQSLPNSKDAELTLQQNTISKIFDNFASIYKKGVWELEAEGLNIKSNPFENFKCETIDTNKEKLTEDEIKLIEGLPLEKDSLIWHCRNYFLFAYYCAGMRAGDLIQLRGINITSDKRLIYRMDKTSTQKNIKLFEPALNILSHYMDIEHPTTNYIFPLLDNNAIYAKAISWEDKEKLPAEIKKNLMQQVNSKNSLINKYLKQIADIAGINKKLSMHIARHSFANIARQKNANVYDISNALGHSDIKITETYLSQFDYQSQDKTMAMVFDSSKEDTNKEELIRLIQGMKANEIESLIKQVKR